MAPESLQRFKGKLREVLRRGRGRNLRSLLRELRPQLIGWASYFRKSEVRGVFRDLDGWIRRKLRAILWRQWKRPATRARSLIRLGLAHQRAWTSATNGRGPWWNAGARHMNQAVPNRYFTELGLVSLHQQLLQFSR